MTELTIKDLKVAIGEKEIVKGLSLQVRSGEIHAIMGPNGSGKSTMAFAVLGHPKYKISNGDILLDGNSLLELKPDQRAKLGLFLSFQYPSEIAGVKYSNFLKMALNAGRQSRGEAPVKVMEFHNMLKEEIKNLSMEEGVIERNLNEGFSGGEKKRSEILQMAILKPRIAILDETDSGLDIDALKVVAENVKRLASQGIGVVVITHYQRILKYLQPDHVHIMIDGSIVESGGKKLAEQLEESGYSKYLPEVIAG